jgi:two-component system response regulator YesN
VYAEAVAERFGISREYVCRIVKSSMGLSVVAFLHRMRIEEAKRLLRESKDCIYQIADQVGFKSPCYFSKVFKELEGRSPKEYRRLHLLGDRDGET